MMEMLLLMSDRTRLIASIFVALIPAIVLVVLIAVTQQSTLYAKHPTTSDEIVHWAQAATFRTAGLTGGYYTANERTAPLSLFHFYSWGPVVPIFYGTIAYLTGWQFYTPILINLGLLGIATVLFIIIARLRWRQIGWIAIILLTYPPLVMFTPTIMLQVLYQAIAVVLALMFQQIVIRNPVSDRGFAIAVMTVFAISLMRPTWCLLLIPLFIIHIAKKPSFRKTIGELSLLLALITISIAIYYIWSAPYPNVRNRIIDQLSGIDSLLNGLRRFLRNTGRNIGRAFDGDEGAVILRLQMLIIAVFSTIPLVRAFRLRKAIDSPAQRLAIVNICNLVGIFAFVAVAYTVDGWRDYRAFAPHVLFSLLLLVLANHERLLKFLIGVSLISYVSIWPRYSDTLNDFNLAEYEFYTEQVSTKAAQYQAANVQFRPDATSPWCNTVLYTQAYFSDISSLAAFDNGLGLSMLVAVDDLQTRPLSRYLLLDDVTREVLGEKANIELLVDLPRGALYENLDSACEEPVSGSATGNS